MSIGEKLQKLRNLKKLTIREVATQLNVSPSTYHDWENDVHSPTARHFASLIAVLGISATDLVDSAWTVTLTQPAPQAGEAGETVMQGNALRMFEIMHQNQQNQNKRLEAKIEQLEDQLRRLRGRA